MRDVYPVISNTGLNQNYYVLEVNAPAIASSALPGQFCQILPVHFTMPMLRIPISIYDVEGKAVKFMIKVVGQGTSLLSQLQRSDMIDIIGPLGNGFQYKNMKRAVLVSGGVGYAPLAFLKTNLANIETHWLHGGTCKDDTFPCDDTYTNDGSLGSRGFVTDGLKKYLSHNKTDMIYACGPKAMLATCVSIAKEHQTPIQVSMEEYMACGIGVCYGCVIPVVRLNDNNPLYKRVCKDGPIFNGYEVDWNE